MATQTYAPAGGLVLAAQTAEDSPLSEMFAQEPSRVTRRFLYALLIFLVTAVVVAAVVHVDVTVTAPAMLIPEGKALAVQPEVGGTVVQVSVEEGTHVARGDVLAVLDSEKAGEQLLMCTRNRCANSTRPSNVSTAI